METELARAVDVMMTRAKRIYILIIKVNKMFSLFSSRCFLKEIENMFSVFLSSFSTKLVYLKDSNAASHFVNSLMLFALRRTRVEVFCLRMLRKKIRVTAGMRKSQNGSGFKKFFSDVSLCNS